MKELFEGLGDLGFDNLDDMDTFQAKDNPQETLVKKASNIPSPAECVFEKGYSCPVCNENFKAITVKSSKLRFVSTDIDLMPTYSPFDPFYYNIVICPRCGYAALTDNFMRVTESQAQLILNEIAPKFKNKKYPFPLTEDMAIERYKFALLNSIVKKGRASEKAYICLVISWLYKIKKDEGKRLLFTSNAYDAFCAAYNKDSFPIYGMNEVVTAYLIAELARYSGNTAEATKWLSKVLGSRVATPKVKDMALELKHRILSQNKLG